MTQAILCTFHGATPSKPPRIRAVAYGGSVTIPYALKGRTDADAPYWDAARALCKKLGWGTTGLTCGTLHKASGALPRVFTFNLEIQTAASALRKAIRVLDGINTLDGDDEHDRAGAQAACDAALAKLEG